MRLKLKFYKDTYPKFYEVLIAHFGLLLDKDFLEKNGEGSYLLWSGLKPGTNEKLLSHVFRQKVTGDKFWVNRISLYENNKEDFREESAIVMIYAFEFLGFTIPEDIKTHLNPVLKARILYQLYLESHQPNFLKNFKQLKVYSHETNSVIVDDDDWAEVLNVLDDNLTNVDDIENIKNLIYSYFNCINNKRFDELLSLINIKVSNDLDEQLNILEDSHQQTISIDEINILDFSITDGKDNEAEVKVFFWEERYIYMTDSIYAPQTIGYLDNYWLVDKVDKLLTKISPTSEQMNSVLIKDLLHANFADNLAVKFDISSGDLVKYFPIKEIKNLPRLVTFLCIKDANVWKISNIEKLETSPYNPLKNKVRT